MTSQPPVPAARWVVPLRSLQRPLLRLVCFHYAGAGPSVFREWPRLLPPSVEVCAVHLPGRETRLREKPLAEMPPLVEALAEHLCAFLDLPVAFFGHSMGAVLAFEVARSHRKWGRQLPEYLFVSGRRAPQLPCTRLPVGHLPDAEFVDEINRRYQAIPDVVRQDPGLMALFLPALRADFALLDSYVCTPEEPLNCPIAAFGGADDEHISAADLSLWREQTTAAFTAQMFPGGHFFVNSVRQDLVGAIAGLLGRREYP
jgi:surfactin synthase thioesterase subunit